MRKLYFLALLAIVACQGCRHRAQIDCTDVLIDLTDSFPETERLSTGQIMPMLAVCSGNTYAGAEVDVSTITNLKYNGDCKVSIPAIGALGSNEVNRKKEIEGFVKRLGLVIDSIKALPVGIIGSSIYEAVALHLEELAACKTCTNKSLIILSDCRQLTAWLNTYDTAQLAEIERDPDKIANLMDKKCPVHSSLSGITIFLIHQPVKQADDNAFYIISPYLKSYYEAKGANVVIETTLNE